MSCPVLQALREHRVAAKVVDCDHYRIHGGLAVETDFIVAVTPPPAGGGAAAAGAEFEAFTLSKTYSAVRTLALQLKHAADAHQKNVGAAARPQSPAVVKLLAYCHAVYPMVDAQRTAYLGKVNYLYVKSIAKQRRQILDHVLAATCHAFPTEPNGDAFLHDIATIVQTFFLTDHVEAAEGDSDCHSTSTISHDRKFPAAAAAALDSLNPLAWIGMQGSSVGVGSHGHWAKPKPSAIDTTPAAPAVVVVVPMTRRSRRSIVERDAEDDELRAAGIAAVLLVDDDRPAPILAPNYAAPVPTVRASGALVGAWVEDRTNPYTFIAVAIAALALLQRAAHTAVTVDGDIFLLCVFACYCLGLHTPRPVTGGGVDRRPAMSAAWRTTSDVSGRKLLRHSMIGASPPAVQHRASVVAGPFSPPAAPLLTGGVAAAVGSEQHLTTLREQDGDGPIMCSPMAVFPAGAAIGTHLNCWARPDPADFHVRGPHYLLDKKKVASGDYLFPCRGVDLFLTDACPQNVGRNAGVMGGRLRDVPTFIVNFRLPWGVLLLYCEIPIQFLPFAEAFGDAAAAAKLEPVLKDLTASERTVARWLMRDAAHKNKTLKIVPVVVDGPWVVKSVVGGKPALIGAKLPISYVHQPAEGKNALYLEADLDIAASSAARGILSVARSYTQALTINLGFVIQGNAADELPERMLTGARLHGINPLTAPCLPPTDADDMAAHLAAAARIDDEASV